MWYFQSRIENGNLRLLTSRKLKNPKIELLEKCENCRMIDFE
jgi:hypothetical protein